ncbi:hypothetical protein U5N28_14780, partial [Lysinibacillus telephonicus]|uniref:hypothetical protein n=1 Tax=Lysinibacillus telephonicus TaxID=1714840 RepID=UPI0039792D97
MNEPAAVNIGMKIIAKYMLHIIKLSIQERLKVRMKAIIKKIIRTTDKEAIILTTLLHYLTHLLNKSPYLFNKKQQQHYSYSFTCY